VADAKTRVIPFGEFLPDMGELNNGGLTYCQQVWPYGMKYIPTWPVQNLSGSLTTGSIQGGIAAAVGSFQYQIYVAAGAGKRLYEVASAGASPPWTATDRSPGNYTPGDWGWGFAQFGNYILACDGWTDEVQYKTYGTADNFASATTGGDYPYRAKCIGVLGQFVVIGNTKHSGTLGDGADENPYRVAWCGRDDILDWSDPTTQVAASATPTGTDYQDLYDDLGEVSGIAGSHDYALIFKHRGIYRMQMGGPFGASFRLVSSNIGCSWPHSIKVVGTDVYWWGPNGPCVYRGLSGEIVELGLHRITRTLLDSIGWIDAGFDSDAFTWSIDTTYLLSAGHDACTGTVVWGVPVEDGDSAIFNYLLVAYSYVDDRFSIVRMEDHANPSGNTSTTEYVFDNPPVDTSFVPGRDLLFAGVSGVSGDERVFGFSAEHGIVATPGSAPFLLSDQLKLRTGYIDLVQAPDGRPTDHRPKRIRVVYNIAADASATQVPQWNVTVKGRNHWGDTTHTYTANSTDDMNTNDRAGYAGWISLPDTAFHQVWQFQFELERTMGTNTEVYVAEIEGFEVMYAVR
jgi:hypothetical protein